MSLIQVLLFLLFCRLFLACVLPSRRCPRVMWARDVTRLISPMDRPTRSCRAPTQNDALLYSLSCSILAGRLQYPATIPNFCPTTLFIFPVSTRNLHKLSPCPSNHPSSSHRMYTAPYITLTTCRCSCSGKWGVRVYVIIWSMIICSIRLVVFCTLMLGPLLRTSFDNEGQGEDFDLDVRLW